jgi:hypothetical protein
MNKETLNLIADQVKVGLDLIDQIETLKGQIEKTEYVNIISFEGYERPIRFYIEDEFLNAVKKTYVEVAKMQLKRLEEELAEFEI